MPQVKKGYSLTHAFRFYRKKYKNKSKNYKDITLTQYRSVCKDFNKMIVDEVLEGGDCVKLPFRMGWFWVKKIKTNFKNPRIDFKATAELGRTVYHTNAHSDNYYAKWSWSKRKSMIKNLVYYDFKATWSNVRAISRIMFQKDGHKRYLTSQHF